jgi:programmed cell death 6-interacting protein
MVKAILASEITTPANPALFGSLVPYSVRQAIGLYNERKNTQISKQLVAEWEGITSQGHALLRELGLPGSLQAIEVPLGLPPTLLTHMDDLKAKGGIQKLKQMRTDVRNLWSSDKQIYELVFHCTNSGLI